MNIAGWFHVVQLNVNVVQLNVNHAPVEPRSLVDEYT